MYSNSLTPARQAKFRQVINHKQVGVSVILEDVLDSHNIAAVMRSCDAVGIHHLHIIHNDDLRYCKIARSHPTDHKKASGNTAKWLQLHYHKDTKSCLEQVKAAGVNIWATHLSAEAHSLYEVDLTTPVALLFGNEREGVSPLALSMCDGVFTIPMVGMSQSLNISVACAVSLYELLRQRIGKGLYTDPSMDLEERESIFRQWEAGDIAKKNHQDVGKKG